MMKEKKDSYVTTVVGFYKKMKRASKEARKRKANNETKRTRDLNRRHPKSLTKERKFSKTPCPRIEPVTRFQEDAVNRNNHYTISAVGMCRCK